jgi:hypothetical protein
VKAKKTAIKKGLQRGFKKCVGTIKEKVKKKTTKKLNFLRGPNRI